MTSGLPFAGLNLWVFDLEGTPFFFVAPKMIKFNFRQICLSNRSGKITQNNIDLCLLVCVCSYVRCSSESNTRI